MSHKVDIPLPPDTAETHQAKVLAHTHTDTYRERIIALLESRRFDLAVLFLVLFHVSLTATQLSITVFDPHQHLPFNLPSVKVLSWLAFAILLVFVVEQIVRLVAEGKEYFFEIAHFLDLIIVSGTITLNLLLALPEREVAGLLIAFRFWRLFHLLDAAHEALYMHGTMAFKTPEEKIAYLGEMLRDEEERATTAEQELAVCRKERNYLKQQVDSMLNSTLQRSKSVSTQGSSDGMLNLMAMQRSKSVSMQGSSML